MEKWHGVLVSDTEVWAFHHHGPLFQPPSSILLLVNSVS